VVVIRHAQGEMSHLCHLQLGSVSVRVGDTVVRGQTIGRCGASGNSVEPHLHFVLRVGPTSGCLSIPTRFDGVRIVRADPSAPAVAGVPNVGDVVSPAR
jgi:murein DD-endopeptidase MepM/ murein hydrolase activator NlpD